jgi:hypothetical protein
MSLSTQAQSLDALDQLKRSEWVETTSQITENLNSDPNGKGDGSECLEDQRVSDSAQGCVKGNNEF